MNLEAALLAVKMREGPEPREGRNAALETGKGKERNSPPEPTEGGQPC